jgi:hypothetical protein
MVAPLRVRVPGVLTTIEPVPFRSWWSLPGVRLLLLLLLLRGVLVLLLCLLLLWRRRRMIQLELVLLALLRVRQHRKSLRDLLELLLRTVALVLIRMPLEGQLAVGFLDGCGIGR